MPNSKPNHLRILRVPREDQGFIEMPYQPRRAVPRNRYRSTLRDVTILGFGLIFGFGAAWTLIKSLDFLFERGLFAWLN